MQGQIRLDTKTPVGRVESSLAGRAVKTGGRERREGVTLRDSWGRVKMARVSCPRAASLVRLHRFGHLGDKRAPG